MIVQMHAGVALHNRGHRLQGPRLRHRTNHDVWPSLHGRDHRVRGEEFEGAEGEQMEGRVQGSSVAPLRRGESTGRLESRLTVQF